MHFQLKQFNKLIILVLMLLFSFNTFAQNKGEKKDKEQSAYIFEEIVKVKATPVKSQAWTSTCWSFATTSFIESELMRMGKDSMDLSEMYFIRNTYPEKAMLYFRMHGNANFASGGEPHDVINVIKNHGFVPENVYSGRKINENKHKHGEMDVVLKGIMDAIIKNKNKNITPVWPQVIESTLDAYLGKVPETLDYRGKKYTPQSFAKKTGFNPNDYVELTSYSHHPFYSSFSLEIPDNWSHELLYNLPIEDLMQVFDHSLKNGYSLVWAADMSEKEFDQKEGVALLPLKAWEDKSDDEQDSTFNGKEPEIEVTQEYRQKTFDNYQTTDDHSMHIIGISKDQRGDKFYLIKNSWGEKEWKWKYDGYIYVSEAFVQGKTIAILVHKDAIPKKIRKKLKL